MSNGLFIRPIISKFNYVKYFYIIDTCLPIIIFDYEGHICIDRKSLLLECTFSKIIKEAKVLIYCYLIPQNYCLLFYFMNFEPLIFKVVFIHSSSIVGFEFQESYFCFIVEIFQTLSFEEEATFWTFSCHLFATHFNSHLIPF